MGGSVMAGELPYGTRATQPGELSGDARAILLYEANKAEPVVAYILLFTLGLFGAHNFYLRRTGIAIYATRTVACREVADELLLKNVFRNDGLAELEHGAKVTRRSLSRHINLQPAFLK